MEFLKGKVPLQDTIINSTDIIYDISNMSYLPNLRCKSLGDRLYHRNWKGDCLLCQHHICLSGLNFKKFLCD